MNVSTPAASIHVLVRVDEGRVSDIILKGKFGAIFETEDEARLEV